MWGVAHSVCVHNVAMDQSQHTKKGIVYSWKEAVQTTGNKPAHTSHGGTRACVGSGSDGRRGGGMQECRPTYNCSARCHWSTAAGADPWPDPSPS